MSQPFGEEPYRPHDHPYYHQGDPRYYQAEPYYPQGDPRYQGYMPYPGGFRPPKSHAAAILLSFFLGTFGIDRFYLGHAGVGIAKLLLSWATFGVWQLIDFILIIVKGTYGLRSVNWQ